VRRPALPSAAEGKPGRLTNLIYVVIEMEFGRGPVGLQGCLVIERQGFTHLKEQLTPEVGTIVVPVSGVVGEASRLTSSASPRDSGGKPVGEASRLTSSASPRYSGSKPAGEASRLTSSAIPRYSGGKPAGEASRLTSSTSPRYSGSKPGRLTSVAEDVSLLFRRHVQEASRDGSPTPEVSRGGSLTSVAEDVSLFFRREDQKQAGTARLSGGKPGRPTY
jgi:hypothetical protein